MAMAKPAAGGDSPALQSSTKATRATIRGSRGTDHTGLAGTGVTLGVDFKKKKVEAGAQKPPSQGQPAPIPFW